MNHLDIKHSRREQLDRAFAALNESKLLPSIPKKGWIAEVRTLLLMTTAQLARRVGVAQSVISNFEKSEREKAITLQSLEKVANALECELHYVFIPRNKNGLEGELHDRAEKLHRQKEKKLEHHMRLEGQGQSESVAESVRTEIEILKLYKRVWDQK
ncbi:MAG: helix-turn-helix domain-containing protein [Bdellovibrionales bacterium]|nr:helix-turn-helix domain-containing protein [Bdellovibrionales bacterium]